MQPDISPIPVIPKIPVQTPCQPVIETLFWLSLPSQKTELLMLERMNHTMHEETRQGEAYAPFVNDPIAYNKKFYIESYGCAMNFADSEIVASILNENG